MNSTLRIQLPANLGPADGRGLPPLDPPPFESRLIRKCIRHAARVQRLDDRPDSFEEFLILTSMNLTVEEMLEAGTVAMADDCGDAGGGADDGGGDDMFYDSDDFSDFSDSEEESEEDAEDEDVMEEESVDDMGESADEVSRQESFNNKTAPRDLAQCTGDPNRGAPMKAFLKGKRPLLKNLHHSHYICIYHAKVLQKADLNWMETGEEVAIKEVSWEAIRASQGKISEDFVKEVAALQYVAEWHKNEMNGRSILDTHVMSADVIMSDESNLYIVMPYCAEGDLCQRMTRAEDYRLTEDEARHWFKQILKGLESLRLMRICHKDLSPENFIILQGKSLAIDFGMCLRIPYSDAGIHPIAPRAACGKAPHIAPEILLQRPFDGHAVDLWAAGTILHFMLTGTRFGHPLTVERDLHIYDLGIGDAAMDLLRKMLRRNPNNRLRSLEEIRDHQWVRYQFLCQR